MKTTIITILLTIPLFALAFTQNTIEVDNSGNYSDQFVTGNGPITLKNALQRTEYPNWDYLLSKYNWPIIEARKVMLCESGGNSQAIGDRNTPYHSYGLFQIRGLPGRPSASWLLDPENNVKYAYELYTKSLWSPWTCKP